MNQQWVNPLQLEMGKPLVLDVKGFVRFNIHWEFELIVKQAGTLTGLGGPGVACVPGRDTMT